MRGLGLALTLLLVLLAPLAAEAVGPVVAPTCTALWGAVTTYTDGTPITAPVTYNVYIVSNIQTAPAVPPALTGLTTTSAAPCLGRAAGQYTAFISAVVGGTESAMSAAVPFVLSLQVPAAPGSVLVK